ncbi:hypothetical protein AD948_11975 [Acetobacter senegalensis]|uniref:Uncharacterized protein n=1 Tax=Acetobacter senegalensis TaxID=446692 RepID=A0A149TYH6_9PROT|nr:hypothetical protein [Acetobacter senegalensis]KXV58182.1 hypothetical protein AD948_11975 [Acetobacter senegalensis]
MKLPAALPPLRQKSAEDLFDEACREANLPPKDPLHIILQEVRGQVATLSVMVQATRDRNQLLETRLAVVLEQARRQDELRVNRNRSEIERLISQRMTGFSIRGFFGNSMGDALFSFLLLLAVAGLVFVLGTLSERQRGLVQTAYEHPLFLRDINDIAVDVSQNERDVKNWATILEMSRGHTQDMMRECRETAQETKEGVRCTVHFTLTQPKAPS